MRTRRIFQPTLDWMPTRIVPSDLGVVSPMDPTSTPTITPPSLVSPMDPTSSPGTDPGLTDPTIGGPGSFIQPSGGSTVTTLC
jgi:hypothetical protein